MFEEPHFSFDWEEIYLKWQEICEEEGLDPRITQVLGFDVDSHMGDLDINDYDWVPVNSKPSRVGPKKVITSGYTYYTSRVSPASRHTVSLLMGNLENKEVIASIWIAGCAFQLYVDFPSYWRGMHNHSFLESLFCFCRDVMKEQVRFNWHNNSKRVFPQKFFSNMLLETVDYLTIPQFIRLAALNAQYYVSKWIVVKYTIDGLGVDEHRLKQDRKVAKLIEAAFCTAPSREKGYEQLENSDVRREDKPQHRRPRLLIPENDVSEFHEGRRKHTFGSAIERNTKARRVCLEHYGPTCVVCGINFEEKFGEEFAGIIDVHHVAPLSQKKGDHLVDPIEDMVPLCPNCHRMIHRKEGGVYHPDELRELITRRAR